MPIAWSKLVIQQPHILKFKLFGRGRTPWHGHCKTTSKSSKLLQELYHPVKFFSTSCKRQYPKESKAGTPREIDPSLEWLRSGKKYLDGPNQVIPSTAMYTWHIDGAVKFNQLAKEPGKSRPPQSVSSILKSQAELIPNTHALAVKQDGKWKKWTFEQYYEDCRKVAKAFIALGLERFHGVCILGFNSPEWFISNIGAMMAGGIPAGIYTTNISSACAFIAKDSKASIFIVDDDSQLSKILPHRKNLPYLKAIIQYRREPKAEDVLSWKQLLTLGEQSSDETLNQRLKQIAINQCGALIYTSGTTGNPKGVMLSHDNLTWPALEFLSWAKLPDPPIKVVSYLPLSHVAAQHSDIYLTLVGGAMVYFAEPDALRGSLVNTMREVQPSLLLAVPRVWEKFYEKLREIAAQNSGIKLKIASWAKAQATECNTKRMAGIENPDTLKFKLAQKLIFSKIHQALGLSNAKFCISAAAPISIDILEYFRSLDVLVSEAYGLSECSGPHTCSLPLQNRVRFGSIGQTLNCAVSRVHNPTGSGEGELCIGGRHVFMGYLNREIKTKQAIDKDGWFHTEDLARIDKDGFVFITGRIKEILITAGGENVAPVSIENNIKACLPCISNAMLVGDRLKFVSAMLTLKTEIDPNTNVPLEELTESSKEWINKHGSCKVKTVKDVLVELNEKNNKKLINAIDAGIAQANTKSTSRASKVKKWTILPKDFSIPGGELGPTLKLKRSVVLDQYKHVVDELYKGTDDPNSDDALGG